MVNWDLLLKRSYLDEEVIPTKKVNSNFNHIPTIKF